MHRFDLDTSLPSDLYNQDASSWINESFNVEDNDVFNNTWSCPPTKLSRRRYNSEHPQMNTLPVQPVFQFNTPLSFVPLPRLPLDPHNPTMPISRNQLLTPAALQGRPIYNDYDQYRPRSYSDSVHSRMAFAMNMGAKMKPVQPMQNPQLQRRMEFSSMKVTFYEPRRSRSGRSSRHNSTNSSDEECAYCRSVSLPSQGHNKYACPVLAALSPCAICGAEGVDNHTASHCPSAEKELLELKPEFVSQSLLRQRLRHYSDSDA